MLSHQVQLDFDKLEIKDGMRPSDTLLSIISAFLEIVSGDIPDHVAPEITEALYARCTYEVNGTMTLLNPAGGVLPLDKKDFVIHSDNAVALLKNQDYCTVQDFPPHVVTLPLPLQSLADLNGRKVVSFFANAPAVNVGDLIINTLFAGALGGVPALLGIDELNVLDWTLSAAEYDALINQMLFGYYHPLSQNKSYYLYLREHLTLSGACLFVDQYMNQNAVVNPVDIPADLSLGIPTLPPTLVIR